MTLPLTLLLKIEKVFKRLRSITCGDGCVGSFESPPDSYGLFELSKKFVRLAPMSWRCLNDGIFISGITIALAYVGTAAACPVCDGPTGFEVRAGLAADGMGKTIFAMVIPFVVLVAGVRIYSVGFANFFRFQSSKP